MVGGQAHQVFRLIGRSGLRAGRRYEWPPGHNQAPDQGCRLAVGAGAMLILPQRAPDVSVRLMGGQAPWHGAWSGCAGVWQGRCR